MVVLCILLIVFICVLCAWMKNKYGFWQRRNINGPAPFPIVGNFGKVLAKKQSPQEYFKEVYENFSNEPVVGIYQGFTPAIVMRDPKLIKQILIKDFHLFQDRGLKKTDDRLNENLFKGEGETWRVLRQKLTPIFTSGKLKGMMPLLHRGVDNFMIYVDCLVENNTDHEIQSLVGKYCLETIGSCAFGVEMNTFTNENNVFRDIAKEIFSRTLFLKVRELGETIIPGFSKFLQKLNIEAANNKIRSFFMDFVTKIVCEREGKPKTRKDFMDLLIELKEQGRVTRRDGVHSSEIEIDDEIIAAQALVIYAAGFEPSSLTMAYVLYELALNKVIQDGVYAEISQVISKYNDIITYDSLHEMNYLEMVFDESLRKHSLGNIILRKSSADYTFPGTNIKIDKDTPVYIPANGLHVDSKYFENPQIFDPERFSPENRQKIPQCVYLPFGDGPRHCIGMRFGKVQSLLGIAAFLQKYKVEPSLKTETELKYVTMGLSLRPRNGIWLKISKR